MRFINIITRHGINNKHYQQRHIISSRSPGRRSRSTSPGNRIVNNPIPERHQVASNSSSNNNNKFNYRSKFAPATPAFKRSQQILNEFRH